MDTVILSQQYHNVIPQVYFTMKQYYAIDFPTRGLLIPTLKFQYNIALGIRKMIVTF